MREAERSVAPFRELESLYSRNFLNVTDDLMETEHLLRAALPEISSAYCSAIEAFQPAVEYFRDFQQLSPPMKLLAKAHTEVSSALASHADLSNISHASAALSPHWMNNIAAYELFSSQTSAAELALKSHYTSVTKSALLAQERMLGVHWENLGRATTMRAQEFSVIRERFTELTESYGDLMRSFDQSTHFMADFPPIFSGGPPIEILTSARILESLTEPSSDEARLDIDREAESEIEDEIEASVDELLAAVDPGLRKIWRGARDALRSQNPDRTRHVAFSLRELVTHVLHALAPDNAVHGWAPDKSYLHNGRPTRRARVLFVCRRIDHGAFTNFIRADVKASVEFINLFQRGHELSISFSEEQLRTLVTRTEAFLRFLILTHRSSD